MIDVATKEKKLTLRGYFYSLPTARERTLFMRKIADNTLSSDNTVRTWIYGKQRPDALKKSILSKITGIPVNELFDDEQPCA